MATTTYGSMTSNRMRTGTARVRHSGGAKSVVKYASPKVPRVSGIRVSKRSRGRKSTRRY